MNLYAFVGNLPISLVDLFGQDSGEVVNLQGQSMEGRSPHSLTAGGIVYLENRDDSLNPGDVFTSNEVGVIFGDAKPSLTVGDMFRYFAEGGDVNFLLRFDKFHPLTGELRSRSYTRSRRKALAAQLEKVCATQCSVKNGTSYGRRRANTWDFVAELPANATGALYEAGGRLIGSKGAGDWPLENFLGSYTMNIYYHDVDCCKGTAKLHYDVLNRTDDASLSRAPWDRSLILFKSNRAFSQWFEWEEALKFKPNLSCPKNTNPLDFHSDTDSIVSELTE